MKMDPTVSRSRSFLEKIYPWLIEFWMAAVLLGFFVVRILGSGLGQRVLSSFGIRATP
jgi:hypothetical protein